MWSLLFLFEWVPFDHRSKEASSHWLLNPIKTSMFIELRMEMGQALSKKKKKTKSWNSTVLTWIYQFFNHERSSLVAQMIKNLPAMQETGVWSLGQKGLLEKEMVPTPVFLPGEFHGQRSLVNYGPWDPKELDMTEWLLFHFVCSLWALFSPAQGPLYPKQSLRNFHSVNAWWVWLLS